MYIKIAERLKPFSHLPGASCILPGSFYQLQIFPTCLKVFDLSNASSTLQLELHFELLGPIKGFTVQNDLEKGEVRIWGETTLGFVRYCLKSSQGGCGFRIHIEKAPQDKLCLFTAKDSWCLKAKDTLFFFCEEKIFEPFVPTLIERLSLGNSKSQDWEMVQRRQDLAEVFPVWHRLGQFIPELSQTDSAFGTFQLLKQCQELTFFNTPEKIIPLWTQLLLTGFTSLLVPQFQDHLYQGILKPDTKQNIAISPLVLLQKGSKLISELFVRCQNSQVELLPALPPEFHCGRLLDKQMNEGTFSIEWTKKRVRRCEFKVNAEINAEIAFCFRHAKQCRLRSGGADKGRIIYSGQLLHLEKKQHYFFDNFS